MVGKIVIGTEVDTSGLEQGLKKIKKTDEQLEMEAELKAKGIEIPEDEAKAIAEKLNRNLELDSMSIDLQVFDMEIAQAEQELLTLQTYINNANALELSDADMWNLYMATAKTIKKLRQLEEQKRKVEEAGGNGFKKAMDEFGKSVKKTIKNIAKMALAMFGIRGAVNAVRSAMNTITSQDEKLKADVEFIKTAFAYVLEPVIRAIVNLMKTLAQYVAYVVKAWTGRDIFASARKNLKAGAKSAKEINKSMAGFDEAQTLSSNKGGDSGGGVSDLGQLGKGEIPGWLQWIVDNKDTILAVIAGLVAGITAFNLGLTVTQSLGVGLAIAGVVYAIEKIIDYLKDPTFENFIGIIEGIAIAVTGVAVAFGAWPVAIGAAIAFVVLKIVENYDKIMELFNKGVAWLDKNVLGWLKDNFGILGEVMYLPIRFFVDSAKGTFESFFGGIKKMFEGVKQIIEGDFWGGIKKIFGGMLSVMTAPLQGFLKAVKNLWTNVKEIFSKIIKWVNDKFIKPIKEKVSDFGSKVGETVSGAFKAVVNAILKTIETVLNAPIKAINKLIDIINDVPGISIKKLATFSLPRLAKGGIVNMPGKGVPVGGAFTGERGAEGVIPLTDSQQMEMIGQAIGRYVTINLTNITKLDARQIAKEIRKVMAENDFATNGW